MAERHRRTGYVAVELCRHHPELESLALPAEDRMHSASGAVVRNLRKWFAIALERLPINIPATWENVLRDHYVAGIKEYMREHKLAKLPEARAFPITFSASSPLLGHKTGSEKGLSWRCTPGKDEPGHGIYGPGLAIHDDDQLEADFFIGWASTELNTRPLAVLDVFDQSSDTIIATASVKSTAISSSDVRVRIPFSGRTGQRLEFRVFWHGTCPLEISRIEVHRASRSLHGGS